LFNWARGEGYTSAPNPCQGIKFSRAEKNSYTPMGRRKIYVTDSAFQGTYERAKQFVKDSMDLAYLTGQRPSDLLAAMFTDIDEDRVLWVEQQKTGKRVGIKVEGDLAELLERIKGRQGKVQSLYIISDKGQRVLYGKLNRCFREARGDDKWEFRDIRAKTASDSPDLKSAQQLL